MKRRKKIILNKPKKIEFSYFPIIVYDNSYITIKWDIKHCLFVRINNKIGFRKRKGEAFRLIKTGTSYKLKAYGLFGIKQFILSPDIRTISRKEIKAKRLQNQIKELKSKENLKIKLNAKLELNNISEKTLITFQKEIIHNSSKITIENIKIIEKLNEIEYANTLNKIKILKNKYYV